MAGKKPVSAEYITLVYSESSLPSGLAYGEIRDEKENVNVRFRVGWRSGSDGNETEKGKRRMNVEGLIIIGKKSLPDSPLGRQAR